MVAHGNLIVAVRKALKDPWDLATLQVRKGISNEDRNLAFFASRSRLKSWQRRSWRLIAEG
jgi:hypothetical protein